MVAADILMLRAVSWVIEIPYLKTQERGKWVIVSAAFRLRRRNHLLNLEYGAIQQTLQAAAIEDPIIQDVSRAVIGIRQQRLPDPAVIPNAGSFFKNPVISQADFIQLRNQHPDMPGYELPAEHIKIPAGWLIEQCGWKGRKRGGCGVHKEHALVLINYGHASGSDILALANEIQASVIERFGIALLPEVNVSSVNSALT